MHSMLLVVSLAAAAGPEVGPVVVAETPGGAVSDFGSWYAVKAVTAGARAQEPGSLAIYDARPNTPGDRPLGIFSVAVLEGASPRLQGARVPEFRAYGWDEHPADGALSADVDVHTLERNVFAVVLTLRGVSVPLTLSAVLEGTAGATGTALGNAITVDDGRGRPFGLFAGSTASTGTISFTGGAGFRWQGTFPVTADGTVGFVLAFHDEPASAEALGSAALAGHGAPDGWADLARARWADHLAVFPPAEAVPQAWAEADVIARATLRMNQDGRGGGLGIARSKTHADHFWLLDAPIAALALSEISAADGFAALEPLIAGQVPESAGEERGLIRNHVDETGAAPSLDHPLATDDYSAPPVLPLALRTLWERSARDGAARASLERAHLAAAALREWWVRRRDLDANGVVEVNGALEAEMPDSPRFALWGGAANLPLPDSRPRARLNVADLNAWLQQAELELSRTASVLGREDAAAWTDAANARAAAIGGATAGFWDDAQSAWVDYALDASQARVNQGPRTAASFWPLAMGTERDSSRVRRAVAALTSPTQVWSERGISSVAAVEVSFAPDLSWRGAVSPWQTYFVLQGLYRYGFEEEAETLRTRLLDTIAGHRAMYAHYGALSGAGLEHAGSTTTAAVFIEALRRRYEEEPFALSAGGAPTAREGRIRRLLRFGDGAVLAEISAEGTRELPRTRFESSGEIFSGDPMGVRFADPTGAIGAREITVSLPVFDRAEIEITRAGGGGAVEALELEGGDIAFTVRVDDAVQIRRYHFAGDRGCGCGAGAGAPLGALGLLIAHAMARARRRRNERRTAPAFSAGTEVFVSEQTLTGASALFSPLRALRSRREQREEEVPRARPVPPRRRPSPRPGSSPRAR